MLICSWLGNDGARIPEEDGSCLGDAVYIRWMDDDLICTSCAGRARRRVRFGRPTTGVVLWDALASADRREVSLGRNRVQP